MCSIGQTERCEATGCEWKKVFNQYCWERSSPVKEVNVKAKIWSPKFVPAEDTKPFYVKRKKGRVVKEEKKYTEIKIFNIPKKEEIEIDFTKIKTAGQDDWIKKIKTLK